VQSTSKYRRERVGGMTATESAKYLSAQALEEKTKAELAKLQSDTAAPSSFVEEGAPDSFADLDAKLKVRGR